jgi:hypothetical protein
VGELASGQVGEVPDAKCDENLHPLQVLMVNGVFLLIRYRLGYYLEGPHV